MDNLKLLIKYTLIGMASAIIVLFFTQGPLHIGGSGTVNLKEVSISDAKTLAKEMSGSQSGPYSYAAAVKIAAPAVVNVNSKKLVAQKRPRVLDDPLFRRFFGDPSQGIPRKRLETSLGSGVIVSDNGYVLTNNHVIDGADEIQVSLKDGRTVDAKIVGTDPESDLAVLKINLNHLPTIKLGQSDTVEVGDVVLAIGNPFGVGQTVTMGIVSATGRDRLGLSTFENFIQTDAAINPGNSGGALVNAFGHLVGINTAIYSRSGGSQGIGFAIPVDSAKEVTEQIIEHGHVVRGWIGIEIQNITPELAESFNLKSTHGVIIAGVLNHGPADKAGLKPGDIITAINGKEVLDGRHAIKLIARVAPGKKVNVYFLRNGTKMSQSVVTSERPQIQKQPAQ